MNISKDGKPKDLLSWILTDGLNLPDTAVNEDSRLIIIAGRCVTFLHQSRVKLTRAYSSDTTAAALANAFYYITANAAVFKKLQATLDQLFPGGDADYNYAEGSRIPYLDGIINEALRLKPPVPGGLSRITPPQGAPHSSLPP